MRRHEIGPAVADLCLDCYGEFRRAAGAIALAILRQAEQLVGVAAAAIGKGGAAVPGSAILPMRVEAAAYFLNLCDRVALRELGAVFRAALVRLVLDGVLAGILEALNLDPEGDRYGSVRAKLVRLIDGRQLEYAKVEIRQLNDTCGRHLIHHASPSVPETHALGVAASASQRWLKQLLPVLFEEMASLAPAPRAGGGEREKLGRRQAVETAAPGGPEQAEGGAGEEPWLDEALSLADSGHLQEAVPVLLSVLAAGDAFEAEVVIDRLVRAGRWAVPGLVKLLEHEDRYVRWLVMAALGEIGPTAQRAVPALSEVLEDADAEFRFAAAESIVRIAGAESAGAVVPALLEGLRIPEHRVAAALALGVLGGEALPAAPRLIELIRNRAVEVHSGVFQDALGRILAGAGRDALTTVAELIADERPELRMAAAEALGRLGAEAVPLLVPTLSDPHPGVRCSGSRALLEIGIPAWRALPALLPRLSDPQVRQGLVLAFKRRRVPIPS